MRKFGRIAAACAAVAVAAGIGLTAVPVQAAPNPGVWGESSLVVSSSVVDSLAAAGIAISATRHSTGVPVNGGVLISFPFTMRPDVDGLTAFGGGFKFTFPGSSAKAPIKFLRPWLATCSEGACLTALDFAVNGARDQLGSDPFFVVHITSSKQHKSPHHSGYAWAFKAEVHLTSKASVVNSLNEALGANVFTPGMKIGDMRAHYGWTAKVS
ncbi:unannotated protein [freshwater metagenome]|uniref:Unannotated protein n=1 Tax=freshwater metagenome TaxID=449393 RepID=A0A6J7ILC8_9ZZZZ|nr:hypothetical protein [Actinomycetota bacterium]